MNDGKTQNAAIIENGVKLIDTYVTKKVRVVSGELFITWQMKGPRDFICL